jgi:hypothetical protein
MSPVLTRLPAPPSRSAPRRDEPSTEYRVPSAKLSSSIREATVTAVYLFDVADAIDLAGLRERLGVGAEVSRFLSKPATPSYVQYHEPPIVVDGDAIDAPRIDGFRLRVKFFDYGIVSVTLSRPFSGPWTDLVALGQELMENDELERTVEQVCATLVERYRRAIHGVRQTFLSEDYLVFAVNRLERPLTAAELADTHGEEIARLLRGERHALSQQEEDEVLRHRLSYLSDDLVVPTWNAAFVYDTEAGARAALEILEFANSQLLQFRYYDGLLDHEMERIYADLKRPRWYDALSSRRYTRAAQQLHSLFIDVNEITDKTENALKIVGDIYTARLFNLVAARLGLDRWKQNLESKLETLDDIYRFAVEQTGMSRGELLELTIIVILLFELALFFMGIMK